MATLGIRFPIKETQEGGLIAGTKIESEKIKSNLANFFTLKRRQRVMHNNMYSPLFDYIMEPWDELSATNLKSDIEDKVKKYFPDISLEDVIFEFIELENDDENILKVKLYYYIVDLNIEDSLEVNLAIQT